MATPPEGPALDRDRDTTLDGPDSKARDSIAHDRTITPVAGIAVTSPSQLVTRVSGTPRVTELAPGAMVGEYRIEGLLGEGGMGRVYSAIHPVIGKRAAVKVLHPRYSANEEVVERFVQEARAVNQIGHPNIVDIFAFGTLPDGGSFFVMEWLKGESLYERIRRQRLTRDEVCDYVRDISHALEAAHEQAIIHRDLKPENVYLHRVKGDRPQIKLLDFGIAKLTNNEDTRVERTRTGAMMGTPKYIAPEQARGYTVDYRVDIYSLGVMMFELIANRLPFDADNAMDLVAAHLHDIPPRLETVAADVPQILDQLVDSMLSKEAAKRPSLARIRQVLEEVRRLPPGDAALTVPDVRGSAMSMIDTRPPARSRRPIWIAAGAAVAAIAAFVIIQQVISSDPPTSPTTAVAAPVQAPAAPQIVQPPVVTPPAMPPKPQQATVTVKLSREVLGDLTVDGDDQPGKSPWKVVLLAGPHTVTFRPRGGLAITKNLTVQGGQDSDLEVKIPPPPRPKAKPKVDDNFMEPKKPKP